MDAIQAQYEALKKSRKTIRADEFAQLLAALFRLSLDLLSEEASIIELKSAVPGKTYCAFRKLILNGKNAGIERLSRPINSALFIFDRGVFESELQCFLDGNYEALGPVETNRLLYTCSMSFCAVNDVHKVGDKKTPATFFEMFIEHLFAREFKTKPQKQVNVPAAYDGTAKLPTDIVFDLGKGQVKLHVPVKLSTRERVIQAWAHQRVLEGIWGQREFKGVLVVLAETKLDLQNREVIEICLPLQWSVYQRYIAHLERVYYLDVPDSYANLSMIAVKSLGHLFFEKAHLISR